MYGVNGRVKELEALVNTGATLSKIPESVVAELWFEGRYETDIELADGGVIRRKLVQAEIETEGIKRPVLVVIGEEENPLIRYTALELLGFKVNPVTRKL